MKWVYVLISFVFILSCKEDLTQIDKSKIEKEILALNNLKDQEQYLNFLFDEDQKYRLIDDYEIIQEHGRNSREYKDYTKGFIRQDKLNLYRVDKYLERFDFPEPEQFNELAQTALTTVIDHNFTYQNAQHYFPILYKAYKEGKISAGSISWMLGDLYRIKYKKSFMIDGPSGKKKN